MSKYTVGLYTLGCKVAQYETEAVSEAFVHRGFTVLPFSERCDAYVINTCTVTAESDRKSRQFIRRAMKRNPNAVVAVVGCYSQRDPDAVSALGVSVVLGTAEKMTVVDRVLQILDGQALPPTVSVGSLDGAGFEPMTVTRGARTRVYVKIQDGCESRCSYCAIRAARGPLRSKPLDDVIREVEALSASGVREVVLTGIETGCYGRDLGGVTLADLILELDKRRSAERIRLGSLAPELIDQTFVDRVKNVGILAPHFHLSVQSGSDKVLRLMRRRYTAQKALENINRLRDAFPGAQFTTDIMVGFPGESEDDFLETVEFVKAAGFLDVHVFAYSKRDGTDAALMDCQIPEEVKRRRSRELTEVKNLVRDGRLSELVDRHRALSVILEAMDDGFYSAHSDGFVEVRVKAPVGLQGQMVDVIPVSHKNGILICDMI